ncbi:PD40 domain-containing protein [Candidatus Peregrinibacteria bacterium]|nr:PD40 domain-containing protein [Candidatus Peregrinibacteria bacterium]
MGIVANTSGSENGTISLQNEEIIENASNPTYSPDGKSFAYVEKVGDKQVVVKDGVA